MSEKRGRALATEDEFRCFMALLDASRYAASVAGGDGQGEREAMPPPIIREPNVRERKKRR